jgi:hypothetical protein
MAEASTSIAGPVAAATATRPKWAPGKIRLIPAFDADPSVVSFAQSVAGRGVLFVTMAALSAGSPERLAVACLAALVAYLPAWRAILMPLATVLVLLLMPTLADHTAPPFANGAATLSMFAVAAGVLAAARRIGRRGPFAWPVASLLICATVLAGMGALPGLADSLRSAIWLAATTLTAFMWFLAYAISNATGRQPQPLTSHLGVLHPFWGSTSTPFGKGAVFLTKFDARTAEDLAVTQLKALKLMIWANMLQLVLVAFDYAVYAKSGVPSLLAAVTADAAGQPLGRAASIAGIVSNFIHNLLSLSVTGHMFVAACRYAGFRIPRNTYRPLSADSIAEFWNRYYYYFKELLVDMFFMPTFSRLRGWPPRARILAATFCAAGLGNYLFHFFRDIAYVRDLGIAGAVAGSMTYAFYCVILSAGIGCSQLLKQTPRPDRATQNVRFTSCASVVGFYCLVSVFDYDGRTLTLADHLRFFLYIFGMSI